MTAEKEVVGYKGLLLQGSSAEVERLLDALPPYFRTLWARDEAAEMRDTALDEGAIRHRCYRYAGNGELPAVRLWLEIAENETRLVAIRPSVGVAARPWLRVGQLDGEVYARLVDAFVELVQQAHQATHSAVRVRILARERRLREELGKAAEAFRAFALAAYPTTGNLYPTDAQRWYDFVIAAHESRLEPDFGFLRQWLRLNTGLYEETIERVLAETDSALKLLTAYDQRAVA